MPDQDAEISIDSQIIQAPGTPLITVQEMQDLWSAPHAEPFIGGAEMQAPDLDSGIAYPEKSDAQKRREDRIAAMQLFGETASSGKEFQSGLLGAFVDMGVATPPEIERHTRQSILESLPEALPTPEEWLSSVQQDDKRQLRDIRQAEREAARFSSENSPYGLATRRRREIESDLQNQYTERGDYHKINTDDYRRDLEGMLEPEGLFKSESRGERFRSELTGIGGAFGFGFAAMQGGAEYAQYYAQTNSGDYISPEQRATAQASLLPGIGMAIGTIAGAAFGPAGSLFGQFAGGGIGQIASSIIGANDERAQLSREGAETLSTSSGQATQNIKELADAIQSLDAPVAVVKEAIGSIASVGPMGAANGTNLGSLGMTVNALGEYAAGDFSSTAKQLRDPALFGLSQQFRQNYTLDSGGYASLGAAAIVGNDPQALLDRERDITAAGLTQNPTYNAARQRETKPYWLVGAMNGGLVGGILGWAVSKQAGRQADYIAQNTPADPVIGRLNQYSEQYGEANFASVLDQSTVALSGGAIDETALSGGSAADIERASGGFYSALSTATADEDQRAAVLRRMIADPALAGARTVNQRALNESLGREEQYRISGLQRRRENFGLGLDEAAADFAVGNVRDTLNGVSAAAQAPGDIAYYQSLVRTARDSANPLNPAQRDQLEAEGLQGAYQTQQGLFSERLDKVNTFLSGASVNVAQANATGGPSAQFAAAAQEIEGLRQRFAELTEELRTGGQTAADYRREQQELNQTQAQIITDTARQRQGYFTGVEGIDAAAQTAARAGLGRDVLLHGNAVMGGLTTVNTRTLATLQSDLANEPNPARRAQLTAQIAEAQAQQSNDVTAQQTFAPDISQRMADLRAQTAYGLAQASPYADGPQSNPFTAGRGLIAQNERDLTAVRAADRNATDPLAHFANAQQESQLQLQIASLRERQFSDSALALPEMIAGAQGMGAGVRSALVAPLSVSALMSPNPLTGGWGGGGGVGTHPSSPSHPAALSHPALAPATHPYHSDPAGLGTGHGSRYEGIMPGLGTGNIGTPGTPGYSGILEPHHLAPGTHTGAGHTYEGMIIPSHMPPGSHTGKGYQYEGMLPEHAMIHPATVNAAAALTQTTPTVFAGSHGVNSFLSGMGGGAHNPADTNTAMLNVLNRIAQILERRSVPGGQTPFDQTAGYHQHLKTGYDTYTDVGRH